MPKRGCTHSRDPKTKKCRSQVQHDRKMSAVKHKFAKAKLQKSLLAHAMQLRKRRKSKAAAPYSKPTLKTTRV